MKKLILGILLALALPVFALATTTIPWITTNNTVIKPNTINGTAPVVNGSYFTASSTTASSTFANGLNLTGGCFSLNGTCITGGGSGTNYLTNSGVNTFLNTGTFLQAPAINATSTATSTIANLGGTLDASTFSGADIGAQINAAYAALPSTGGRIFVPAGTYSFTTPIVFGTNHKVVNLYCASGGGASNQAVGGTTLIYTATTGTSTTFNTNDYIVGGAGIDNCNIQGTNGTTARITAGVYFGGANGAFANYLRNVNINGFGTGVVYGSNTSFALIDSSTIHFNGRNISEPDTAGANGENMRIINSVIADSNNQAGGATDRFCIYIQESGNVQWQIINSSIDDCEYYVDQFGGEANVHTFSNVHFESPNLDDYRFITVIDSASTVTITTLGGDFMNDVVAGISSYMTGTANWNFFGTVFDVNNNVSGATTNIVTTASTASTFNWSGISTGNPATTYVYGTVPFSPSGYGTGYTFGPTFNIGPATGGKNGTTTIANLYGVLDATTFAGADIGAQVNAAYAAAGGANVTIRIPNGKFTYSTPILCGTNGKRCTIIGDSAGGTNLFYTGSGAAITINHGIQGTGIDHTSGCGVRDLTLTGNNYSTTSPQIGLFVGGTNGSDCSTDVNVNIQHFGYGLQLGANAYHYNNYNSAIRDNGQNLIVNAASNSGEDLNFYGLLLADQANHLIGDCIWFDNSATESTTFHGGQINDCDVHILQANNVSFIGTDWENVGSKSTGWPAYTYITIDNNSATNVNISGGVFFNTATTGFSPTTFISNGGTLNLNGVIVRRFNSDTVTRFVTLTGSGRVSWNSFNNVSNLAVTNVVGTSLASVNGTTGSTTLTSLATAAGAFLAVDPNGKIIATTSPSGTNYLTNSGATTYLNLGSSLQAPSLAATSTTATSTFAAAITVGAGQGTSTFAAGLSAVSLNITSSSASSTFSNGINLAGGCYAINSVCIGGGGSQTPWTSAIDGHGFALSNAGAITGTTLNATSTATSTYTGPIQSSCFSSDGTTCITGTGGSGTVSSGLSSQIAYYGANGTTIIGTSTNPLYIGSLAATSTATSTFGGSVNIGIANGSFPLEVQKSVTGVLTAYIQNILGSTSGDAQLFLGTRATSEDITTGASIYADRVDTNSQFGTTNLLFKNSAGNSLNTNMIITGFGFAGVGTTSPWGVLSVSDNGTPLQTFNTTGYPLFVVASSTTVSGGTKFIVASGGNVGVGTTTPGSLFSVNGNGLFNGTLISNNILGLSTTASSTFASAVGIGTTSVPAKLTVDNGAIFNPSYIQATSSSMTINAFDRNNQPIRMGGGALSVGFTNMRPGMSLTLEVCNPAETAGALTFTGVLWPSPGTMPTQVTTAGHCTIWSFKGGLGTSTPVIYGAQTPF